MPLSVRPARRLRLRSLSAGLLLCNPRSTAQPHHHPNDDRARDESEVRDTGPPCRARSRGSDGETCMKALFPFACGLLVGASPWQLYPDGARAVPKTVGSEPDNPGE